MIVHNGKEITLEDLDKLDNEDCRKIEKPFDHRVPDTVVKSKMQVIKTQQEVVNKKQKELNFEINRLQLYQSQLDWLVSAQNSRGKR